MKELIKPMPLESEYELDFLNESCSSGCNRVCCDTVSSGTGCRENPNRSSTEEFDILL